MGQGTPKDELTRRQFVRLAALMGLGTALASCGSEAPLPSPTPTQAMPTDRGTTAAQASTDTPSATAHQDTPLPTGKTPSPSPTAHQETPQPTGETPSPSPTAHQETPLATGETPSPTATATREPPSPTPDQAYLAVARGSDPKAMTYAALAALGGIERFVKSGDDVIVKPNICVDYRTFEYAATTNPEVVAALVELCLGAGARRVRVMDSPFGGGAKSAYARSGIADAVAAAGGEMEIMNPAKFRDTKFPDGRDIRTWPVYQEVLAADVVIDVPIAKHHNLARLTLGGKNLMGVIQNRSGIHANLGQRIADLVSLVRPQLTVVDAVRTLMNHGPTGGNLDDVRLANTVIASHDIVAADAYAATLFDLTGKDIAYVKAAADMGLGTLDLTSVKIAEIAAG
jgi:uncharacterized protein (DUF362 family)/predicted small lipoprotein YifL